MKQISTYLALATILLNIFSLASNTNAAGKPKATPKQEVYPVLRSVTYSFTLENTTNKLVDKVDFWTYAPLNTSSQQRVKLSASHKYQTIEDQLGNTICHFSFDKVAPFQKIVVQLKSQVRITKPVLPGPLVDSPLFVKPEKLIESDNPAIVKMGKALRKPKAISNWVAGALSYTGYSPYARGALYAFEKKKGDCTDFACLFVALCRSANIPSRVVSGYTCNRDTVLPPAAFHNWAEYADGKSWHLADPQKRMFDRKHSEYLAMSVLGTDEKSPMNGTHRFKVKGDGVKARMNGR